MPTLVTELIERKTRFFNPSLSFRKSRQQPRRRLNWQHIVAILIHIGSDYLYLPKLMFPGLLEATITASSRAICIRTTNTPRRRDATQPFHSAFIRTVMQSEKKECSPTPT
ncbi:hypothetical protein PGT21_025819 [Puccinia graminis f. sp. tritici]|uniref:Uncharacterized protein n=1 Tax=Puccinia graminis f. sp. tritici TaxID=56615 RepID=A0A5B0QJD7_PUCGR|nr:hypothetical protein PGT21_025819 [Puccinia graminis f. sp. tritici]